MIDAELEEFDNLMVLRVESVVEVSEILPTKFVLNHAYPNPFNPITTISYGLPNDVKVSLLIYDIDGRKMTTLTQGLKPAENYSIELNAEGLSSGVYFVKLEAGNFIKIQKLMFIN
jgi:hypothetical protein